MAGDEDGPGLFQRLAGFALGEQSAADLLAFRRAGAAALQLVDEVEARLALQDGDHPWQAQPAEQLEAVAAWCAFAVQTLGDALLDADAQASPATAGMLPDSIREAALRAYGEVQLWVARARVTVLGNREGPIVLPQAFPLALDPADAVQLAAVRAALDVLLVRAASSLAVLRRRAPAGRAAAVEDLTRRHAGIVADAEHAGLLLAGRPSGQLQAHAGAQLVAALDRAYRLGQLVAAPALVAPRAVHPAGPGGSAGFDPWTLTDTMVRRDREADGMSADRIQELWAADPDTGRTLGVAAEIERGVAAGTFAEIPTGHGPLAGLCRLCPWPPQRWARRACVLGPVTLQPFDRFVYLVSDELVAEGGPFVRALVVLPHGRPVRPLPVSPGLRTARFGAATPLAQRLEVTEL